MRSRDLRPDLGITAGPRLLLISYHFPPGQSVGALRWQQLAPYAAARGWGLDVITLDPFDAPSTDDSRLHALPQSVRVFGVRRFRTWMERVEHSVWRAYGAIRAKQKTPATPAPNRRSGGARIINSSIARTDVTFRPWVARDYVRAFLAWAVIANDRAWARSAEAAAREIYEPGLHRAVITSGPPHMCHEAGRRLSVTLGVPHVMDLRDPWSLLERVDEGIASPVWTRGTRWYENRAVRQAALVVMNSEAASTAMADAHPEEAARFITVMNGYDDEPAPQVDRGSIFRVRFAGTIYFDRDPRPLLRAAASVIAELELSPAQFVLEFMGNGLSFEDRALPDLAADEGIGGFVRAYPAGSRRDALAFQAGASMLVTLPWTLDLCIPFKVFEYMMFDAWVLAMVHPYSAAARLLHQTKADVVSPDDLAGIAAVLKERYLCQARGERPPRLDPDGRFSRRARAAELLDAIAPIVEAVPGSPPLPQDLRRNP